MERINTARTLHRLARADCTLENVGRLLISECKQTVDSALTGTAILELLKEFYPDYGYDLRTANVLLVYFDGKQPLQERRARRKPANFEVNHFPASDPDNDFEADNYSNPEEHYAAKPDAQRIIW